MGNKFKCPCCGMELEEDTSRITAKGVSRFSCEECSLAILVEEPFRRVNVATEYFEAALSGDGNEPLEATVHVAMASEDGPVWIKTLSQETAWCVSNWHASLADMITACYEIISWYKESSYHKCAFGKDDCKEILAKIRGIPERNCPFCGSPMLWHLTNASNYEDSFTCGSCKVRLEIDNFDSGYCVAITDISAKKYSSDPHFSMFTTREYEDTLAVVPNMPWGGDMAFTTSIPKSVDLEEQVSVTGKLYKALEAVCSREGIIRNVKQRLVDTGFREEV